MRLVPALVGALLLTPATGAAAQVRPNPLDAGALADVSRAVRNGIQLQRPGSGAPGPVQGEIVEALSPDDVLSLVKAAGIEGAKIVDSDRGKTIEGTVGSVPVEAYPWACENGVCASVVFLAYFGKQDSRDYKLINSWNDQMAATLIYTGDDQVYLKFGVRLYKGVARGHVTGMGEIFRNSVKDVLTFKPS